MQERCPQPRDWFLTPVLIVPPRGPVSKHSRSVSETANADPVASAAVHAGVPQSDADELAKLADLRDKGVISEQEFAAKKAQILGL